MMPQDSAFPGSGESSGADLYGVGPNHLAQNPK
jgi:hypothetical protein